MSEPIIEIDNLGKRYRLRHEAKAPYQTLRETLSAGVRQLAGYRITEHGLATTEEFWALRDVSLEIARGDVVGVIGRNGAGKSTLLKILSRITEPTTGRIRLRGRVASLLEVGTGFHPELTGRENIYLNGAILGMTRAEIRKQFDAMVAFADVERFLDTPVKHYSSGMYVRLAFAVAAHLDPEILVVDEVLAVGDAQFQNKCFGKMRDIAGAGRTVLFVSHNLGAVATLCKKGIMLTRGCLTASGEITDVIDRYLATSKTAAPVLHGSRGTVSGLQIQRLSAEFDGVGDSSCLKLMMTVASDGSHKPGFVAFDILAQNGTCFMQALPTQDAFVLPRQGLHDIAVEVSLPPLTPGSYYVTAWVGSHYTETLDAVVEAASFEVLRSPTPGRTVPHTSDHGYIVPHSRIVSYASAGAANGEL
jgi:lipopolysaccharide transport system ATP-binding protein